jgi:hypothetical protein
MITVLDAQFVTINLDYDDIKKMYKLQEDIILHGKVNHNNDIWKIWKDHACHNESQELLVYSTIFPMRLGLAIQQWYKLYFNNCHKCCKGMKICL